MSGSLFDDDERPVPDASGKAAPLADRMRPQTLDDLVGQGHLLDPGKPLRTAIEHDQVPSMILWGPPGVGKTTLAQIIAKMARSRFFVLRPLSDEDVIRVLRRAIQREQFNVQEDALQAIALIANGDARTA